MGKRAFYSIRQQADSNHAEILIYSDIGPWWDSVDAKTFAEELQQLEVETLDLRINSPGGAVFDGQAIHTSIVNHPATVTAYVDGLAASIASIIMLAAERIIIAPNAMIMIHNPRGFSEGEASDMRKYADLLDKLQGVSADLYVKRTGQTMDDVLAKMNAETWFTADEALDYGLVDAIAQDETPVERLAQGVDVSKLQQRFRHVPERFVRQLSPAAVAQASPSADAPDAPFCAAPTVRNVDPEQLARMNRMLFS